MKKYQCNLCDHVFLESDAKQGDDGELHCPICGASGVMLKVIEVIADKEPEQEESQEDERNGPIRGRYMDEIHQMSKSGDSIIGSMGTGFDMPSWDDILILGGQFDPMPLEKEEPVDTTTVIGVKAKQPLVLENPIFVSHMSFGALSKEAKLALSKGSAMAKTAMCSGEGGILPEEMEAAYKYIFEYVPNRYSVNDKNLKNVDAVEIKIGQGTKPGMGGHLPAGKVTEEIAEIRGKPMGRDIISPAKIAGIHSPEDLKELIDRLREATGGKPIGVKIAGGRIEKDLAFCLKANPDFVTIDGRGGATGASPQLVRDATSMPTIFALYRARKYLDKVESDVSLIITGGLRVSSDFAKALALGADAIAIASGALVAVGCRQYRICGSDKCPMGIATQDPELRKRLDVEQSAQQLANYLNVSLDEICTFARIAGHSSIHELCMEDICTVNSEISDHTGIAHV